MTRTFKSAPNGKSLIEMMTDDPRLTALHTWLAQQLGTNHFAITPASADASFRRYLRVRQANASWIVMDAPPEREDSAPFVDVTQRLEAVGLRVPHVHVADLENGFLLLDDLGQQPYLGALDTATVDSLYADALAALLRMQTVDPAGLPDYDHDRLWQEMALFPDWLLAQHHELTLNDKDRQTLESVSEALAQAALEQPRCFVHRDYHSRNLMVVDVGNPGILDYQDAVFGPITYDLVSLLRDCYIAWPRERVNHWALDYRDRLIAAGHLEWITDSEFLRWLDLMGIQRHLKASGIFARLYHRDGKAGYLADIPRTLGYIQASAPRYAATASLVPLIQEHGLV